MIKPIKCYILEASSESCDHFGPWAFDKKPTLKQIETFLRENAPEEWEDGPGPGFEGSYLYPKLNGKDL